MSDTTETETDTNTNTDEPSKAELHDRVKQLESTVEKLMPSRRDALRMGAAGLAGAVGLGAASQTAEASTGSAGTIGSSGSRPDLLADRVSISEVATKSHQTSDQTIPSGTRTTIDIDSTAFEDTDVVTADFANNQVVIQEDGIYVIDGRVQLRSSSNWSTGDSFKIIISLNGSIKSVIDGRKAGTDRQGMNIRDTVNVSSGDSIRLKISQGSGGSVDTIGLLAHTRLIISRVG